MQVISPKLLRSFFKIRQAESHKGNHGHALIIAGSKHKMGAAIISAHAALRSGLGLLTVSIPMEERSSFFTALPEAMLVFREEGIKSYSTFDALALGPGLGQTKATLNLVTGVLKALPKALVLDADALNSLAKNKKLLSRLPAQTILTPHEAEFDRLFGSHNNRNERIKTAVQKAKQHKVILVLKGVQTFVTNGEQHFLNNSGNPGLAKGGSGDALTGVIVALLAQGYNALQAALLGVYLHGTAADLCLRAQSVESMLISDVVLHLGKAFQTLSQKTTGTKHFK